MQLLVTVLLQIVFSIRNFYSARRAIQADRGSSCYRSRCSTGEKYVEPLMRITVRGKRQIRKQGKLSGPRYNTSIVDEVTVRRQCILLDVRRN